MARSVSLASEHHVSLEIPELGPYLGRLVAPPVIETGQRHWIPLEDIRYELVTEVFVRSGEAREWCAADDPDLTIATLGRSVWLGLWERALTAVSQRASQAINARLGNGILAYADAYKAGPISDAAAKTFLDEALAIEDAEAKLRRDYAAKLTAAIPAAKAARYLQIESKIRAVIRYELAANIPLVK